MLRLDKSCERQARVNAGRDYVGINLITVGQNYASGLALLDDDLCDGRFGTDFDSGFPRSFRDGAGNCACAAAGESPGTKSPVDFSHIVMEQHISRSG